MGFLRVFCKEKPFCKSKRLLNFCLDSIIRGRMQEKESKKCRFYSINAPNAISGLTSL